MRAGARRAGRPSGAQQRLSGGAARRLTSINHRPAAPLALTSHLARARASAYAQLELDTGTRGLPSSAAELGHRWAASGLETAYWRGRQGTLWAGANQLACAGPGRRPRPRGQWRPAATPGTRPPINQRPELVRARPMGQLARRRARGTCTRARGGAGPGGGRACHQPD